MGMEIQFNARELEASILNIAQRAAKSASAELRKTAVKIRDLARDYAPTKSGTLEDAINYMTVKGTNNRNVFVVFVNLDAVNPGGHSVGEYAWIMNTQLRPYGNQGKPLQLGLGSQFKAAGGYLVGGYFLDRAIKEGTKTMLQDATAAVSRTLGARTIPMDFIGGDDE